MAATSAPPIARRLRSGAASAALLVGLALGGSIGVAALLSNGDFASLLALGAIGAPALVAQYALRATRFARHDPLGVVRIDLMWLGVVVVAGVADVAGWWDPGPAGYLGAWLAGAGVSAAGLIVTGMTTGRADVGYFWETAGRQALRLGGESGLARSTFVTSLLTATVMIDDAASGSLAAAVLILSPLSVIHVALSSFFIPRLIGGEGIHAPGPRSVALITVVVTATTALWAGLVALANALGVAVGPFDLDANAVSGGLFLATVARYLGLATWRGPLVALRVADATRESLRVRLISTVAQWTLPIAGFALGGLVLGAVGLAIGTWIGTAAAFAAWHDLHRRS